MDKFQDLYNKLKTNNTIALPDYNTFKQKYNSDTGINTLYTKLSGNGTIQLPDLNTFKSKYYEEPSTFQKIKGTLSSWFGDSPEDKKLLDKIDYTADINKNKPVVDPKLSTNQIGFTEAAKKSVNNLDSDLKKKLESTEKYYNEQINTLENAAFATEFDATGFQNDIEKLKVEKQNKVDAINKEYFNKRGLVNTSKNPSLENRLSIVEVTNAQKIKDLESKKHSYFDRAKAFGFWDYDAVAKVDAENNALNAEIKELGRKNEHIKKLKKLNESGYDVEKIMYDPDASEYLASIVDPSIRENLKNVEKSMGKKTSEISVLKTMDLMKKTGFLTPGFDHFVNAESSKALGEVIDKTRNFQANYLEITTEPYFNEIIKLQNPETGQPYTKEWVNKLIVGIIGDQSQKSPEELQAINVGMMNGVHGDLLNNPHYQQIFKRYAQSADYVEKHNDTKSRLTYKDFEKIKQDELKNIGYFNQTKNIKDESDFYNDKLTNEVRNNKFLGYADLKRLAYDGLWNILRGEVYAEQLLANAKKGFLNSDSDATNEGIRKTEVFDVINSRGTASSLAFFNTDNFKKVIDSKGKEIAVKLDSKGNLTKEIYIDGISAALTNEKEIDKVLSEVQKLESELPVQELGDLKGGTRAKIRNGQRELIKGTIEEVMIAPAEILGGFGVGLATKAFKTTNNIERAQKMGGMAVSAASAYTEMYGDFYNSYKDRGIEDGDDVYSKLVTAALASSSLLTNHLDSRFINAGMGGHSKTVNKEVAEAMPEIVERLSRDYAKIPNIEVRNQALKTAVAAEARNKTLQSYKKHATEFGIAFAQEGIEETVIEPLVQASTEFMMSKMVGNRLLEKESLKDMGFLDPYTFMIAGLTGGVMSGGATIAENIKNPNKPLDHSYLRAALHEEKKFKSLLSQMADDESGSFSKEQHAAVIKEYDNIKSKYDAAKQNLRFDEDFYQSLNLKDANVNKFLELHGISNLNQLKESEHLDDFVAEHALKQAENESLKESLQKKGLTFDEKSNSFAETIDRVSDESIKKELTQYVINQASITKFERQLETFNKNSQGIQKQFIEQLGELNEKAPELLFTYKSDIAEGMVYNNEYSVAKGALIDKLTKEKELKQLETELATDTTNIDKQVSLKLRINELKKGIKAQEELIKHFEKKFAAGSTDARRKYNEAVEELHDLMTSQEESINTYDKYEYEGQEPLSLEEQKNALTEALKKLQNAGRVLSKFDTDAYVVTRKDIKESLAGLETAETHLNGKREALNKYKGSNKVSDLLEYLSYHKDLDTVENREAFSSILRDTFEEIIRQGSLKTKRSKELLRNLLDDDLFLAYYVDLNREDFHKDSSKQNVAKHLIATLKDLLQAEKDEVVGILTENSDPETLEQGVETLKKIIDIENEDEDFGDVVYYVEEEMSNENLDYNREVYSEFYEDSVQEDTSDYEVDAGPETVENQVTESDEVVEDDDELAIYASEVGVSSETQVPIESKNIEITQTEEELEEFLEDGAVLADDSHDAQISIKLNEDGTFRVQIFAGYLQPDSKRRLGDIIRDEYPNLNGEKYFNITEEDLRILFKKYNFKAPKSFLREGTTSGKFVLRFDNISGLNPGESTVVPVDREVYKEARIDNPILNGFNNGELVGKTVVVKLNEEQSKQGRNNKTGNSLRDLGYFSIYLKNDRGHEEVIGHVAPYDKKLRQQMFDSEGNYSPVEMNVDDVFNQKIYSNVVPQGVTDFLDKYNKFNGTNMTVDFVYVGIGQGGVITLFTKDEDGNVEPYHKQFPLDFKHVGKSFIILKSKNMLKSGLLNLESLSLQNVIDTKEFRNLNLKKDLLDLVREVLAKEDYSGTTAFFNEFRALLDEHPTLKSLREFVPLYFNTPGENQVLGDFRGKKAETHFGVIDEAVNAIRELKNSNNISQEDANSEYNKYVSNIFYTLLDMKIQSNERTLPFHKIDINPIKPFSKNKMVLSPKNKKKLVNPTQSENKTEDCSLFDDM